MQMASQLKGVVKAKLKRKTNDIPAVLRIPLTKAHVKNVACGHDPHCLLPFPKWKVCIKNFRVVPNYRDPIC